MHHEESQNPLGGGVRTIFGDSVAAIEQDGDGVRVAFASLPTLEHPLTRPFRSRLRARLSASSAGHPPSN
jgi:hypothetical protein